jgi:CHAT domain
VFLFPLPRNGMKDSGQSGYFWTLDHQHRNFIEYRITTGVAQATEFSQRPLVFGNACLSAAAQSTDLTAPQGFGGSFMIGGALNFVGTLAPITKTMAVTFAKRFYVRLFGSAEQPALPIGEALRATKESFAAENYSDPSYLFYCLYGPCDSTYKPEE